MFAFTLRQIEVFLAVCDRAGFRAAADGLGISEAAVSQHIRELERQLDCKLFERKRGARATLLQAGLAFKVEARTFAERGEELRKIAKSFSPAAPPLRAFVGGHLLEDYVRPALPQLAAEHPQITLDFELHRTRDQVRHDVTSGLLDLVLMGVRSPAELPGSIVVARVGSGIYGVDAFREMARLDLASLPFILSPSGGADDRAQRSALARIGIPRPNVVVRSQFHDGRILSAIRGLGVTFALQSIVAKFDPERKLHLMKRLSDWEIRLYLSDRVDEKSRIALERFFREVVGARFCDFLITPDL